MSEVGDTKQQLIQVSFATKDHKETEPDIVFFCVFCALSWLNHSRSTSRRVFCGKTSVPLGVSLVDTIFGCGVAALGLEYRRLGDKNDRIS